MANGLFHSHAIIFHWRHSNIDFNRQRDGSNRASFVIDNFRISDVARWTSDFDPPK